MMNWNKTKDFKKLQKKWYERLKRRGFKDIEHDDTHLKQFSGKTSIDREDGSSKLDTWAEMGITVKIKDHWKTEYYSRARKFLGEYRFKNKTERKIFEMHSEGVGVRVIADKLNSYRRKVHETLQRLVLEMKKK